MKAIIFDLDNTLIEWKKEYVNALKNVIKEMGYNFQEDIIQKIDEKFTDYEINLKELSKEKLLDYINSTCNLNLSLDFINRVIKEQGKCYEKDEKLVDVIKYLSKKYDLYVISNWFTETQKLRLEGVGILKYFKKVYGSDTNYLKPNKLTYKVVTDIYGIENCLVVGDSLKNDIELPKSLGMKVIWKTNNESSDYTTIKNVYELKDLL